jgi:hypothetical protein
MENIFNSFLGRVYNLLIMCDTAHSESTPFEIIIWSVWPIEDITIQQYYAYAACTEMIGAVSSGHNALEMHAKVFSPHGTKQQIFKF